MTQSFNTSGKKYDPVMSATAAKHFDPEWVAFSQRFSKRYPGQGTPVYVIPPRLIESLRSNAVGWLTNDELDAEQGFAELCQRYHAVGVIDNRPICYDWLAVSEEGKIEPLPMSLFKFLGWDHFWTHEQANHLLRMGKDRIDPLRQQLQSYLGWLITNRAFLREAVALQAEEQAWIDGGKPIEENEELVREFVKFCVAWSLVGMATWDLPIPHEVNLSGLEMQRGIREEAISLRLPPTLRIPARYPLGQLLKEHRENAMSDRLAEWRDVLDQSNEDGRGLRRYRQMLPLHFYRNIVLGSRYHARIQGNAELLDRAFAEFLDMGEDSVKKLRLATQRRLKET